MENPYQNTTKNMANQTFALLVMRTLGYVILCAALESNIITEDASQGFTEKKAEWIQQ